MRLFYIPRTSFLLTTRLSENTILARVLFLFQERTWERPLGPLWIPLCVSVHESTTWNQSICEKFQWLLLADRSTRIYLWSVTSLGIVCYPITATSRFWMCHTICLMVLCQAFLSLLPPPKMSGVNINRRQSSSDKKDNLSLRLVLFFPFRCLFASSLQFSSSTVKQTKLFHSNFINIFNFFYEKNSSRKTFLVECLRSGAASCKRL